MFSSALEAAPALPAAIVAAAARAKEGLLGAADFALLFVAGFGGGSGRGGREGEGEGGAPALLHAALGLVSRRAACTWLLPPCACYPVTAQSHSTLT